MQRTWVVICDASRCRIFEVGPRRDQWKMLQSIEHPQGRAKGQDLLTDKPGRNQQSRSTMRPALEPSTPPHEVEVEKFAHQIAKLLETRLAENAYERLVLVAPPHFLGTLRSTLSANLAKHVALSLDKDYTSLEPAQLAERVPL
jgi:protein required for attachment to host cells